MTRILEVRGSVPARLEVNHQPNSTPTGGFVDFVSSDGSETFRVTTRRQPKDSGTIGQELTIIEMLGLPPTRETHAKLFAANRATQEVNPSRPHALAVVTADGHPKSVLRIGDTVIDPQTGEIHRAETYMQERVAQVWAVLPLEHKLEPIPAPLT